MNEPLTLEMDKTWVERLSKENQVLRSILEDLVPSSPALEELVRRKIRQLEQAAG